jgi:hypothetical protein
MGARLSIDPVVVAIAVLGVWNVVTWATYRLDKARARAARGARRIPERTLLAMAGSARCSRSTPTASATRRRSSASC